MTTPRAISDADAAACKACLLWLANGRFIEERTGDPYIDTVSAFRTAQPRSFDTEVVEDFLMWMDYGDRLRRVGPENPFGVNIEFYSGDYAYDDSGIAREERCAAEMVGCYRDGED